MRLHDDRASGGERRGGVATGHAEGEREVAGGEHQHRTDRGHHPPQVGTCPHRPVRVRVVDGRRDPAAVRAAPRRTAGAGRWCARARPSGRGSAARWLSSAASGTSSSAWASSASATATSHAPRSPGSEAASGCAAPAAASSTAFRVVWSVSLSVVMLRWVLHRVTGRGRASRWAAAAAASRSGQRAGPARPEVVEVQLGGAGRTQGCDVAGRVGERLRRGHGDVAADGGVARQGGSGLACGRDAGVAGLPARQHHAVDLVAGGGCEPGECAGRPRVEGGVQGDGRRSPTAASTSSRSASVAACRPASSSALQLGGQSGLGRVGHRPRPAARDRVAQQPHHGVARGLPRVRACVAAAHRQQLDQRRGPGSVGLLVLALVYDAELSACLEDDGAHVESAHRLGGQRRGVLAHLGSARAQRPGVRLAEAVAHRDVRVLLAETAVVGEHDPGRDGQPVVAQPRDRRTRGVGVGQPRRRAGAETATAPRLLALRSVERRVRRVDRSSSSSTKESPRGCCGSWWPPRPRRRRRP